jgi:phosphoribosylformimino-5-aminoimidazole carboxamide ribotide isomerase
LTGQTIGRVIRRVIAGSSASCYRTSMLARFTLAPSIDLLGGRVVRLRHGDPARSTVYDTDPARTARRWAAEGADLLHVVDLDGALTGHSAQADGVARVVAAGLEAGIGSQVAGGLRDAEAVKRGLATGAERVVLGTALLADADLARRLVEQHGPLRIVAALDVRGDEAVGEGWRSAAAALPLEIAVSRLLDAGIATFAVTSIARDGTMEGPDVALLARVRRLAPTVELLGSGGVRSADDVRALRDTGCDGAILGRAVYEGALTIADARAALDRGSDETV